MYAGKAVFRRQDEGLGQIVAGDDLTLPLRPVQKLPGALEVEVLSRSKMPMMLLSRTAMSLPMDKNIFSSYGNIGRQFCRPMIFHLRFFHSLTASSSQRLFFGFSACPLTQW